VENSVRTRLPSTASTRRSASDCVEYRDIGAHAARLLHCIQKTQPVFEFTAQSVAPRL
jgi:hypothetical protein